MSNRFQEMNDYFNGSGIDARRLRDPAGSPYRPALSQSRSWSQPFSASQRVLIILIDNGGIDLHIPQLVDRIIDALPGSSMIPDSVRRDLRDFIAKRINYTVKSVTRDLLESVELAANRYNAAKPDIYGDVIILRNGAASFNDLKLQLAAQTNAGKLIDLYILTHGDEHYIAVTGGIKDDQIRQMGKDFGKPFSIRSVYMMNCVGSSLNQAWIDIGARTSSGALRNNYLPEPTMFFFWQNWQSGKSFESSVTNAYEQTIQLINDAINSFFSALQLPFIGGLIDAHTFEFVRDSAPVLQGDKSLTVSSDDISFAKSTAASLATTVVPVWMLKSLSEAAASSMKTSQAGIDLIKRFEAYKEKMYNDAAGHCTIGYGTLLHKGNCDGRSSEQPYHDGISESDATDLLKRELASFEDAINATAKTALNQNQFDALASFVYNIGVGAFNKSTLAKLLRSGDYTGVPDEMKKWTKARVDGKLVDLKGLVKRRNEEAQLFSQPITSGSQSAYNTHCGCYGMTLSADRFDTIVSTVFGASDYDSFVQNTLTSTSFLNRNVNSVHPEMIAMLQTAEQTLKAKGITTCPQIDSTLRRRHSLHGLGMAIDFDVLENPYVLNEAGEAELDKELAQAYDHIADFMLGKSSSDLRKLKKGRSAFGGTIANVYDALRAESDAMKQYFGFLKDPTALTAYLQNGWASTHPNQSAPAIDTIQAQIQDDYEVLGGKDANGKKRRAAKGDRPFSASSNNRGDPSGGFLNLDRDFVLALTDAGLAWGAIDMWGASGDIMHFDCRFGTLGKQAFQALQNTAKSQSLSSTTRREPAWV